MKNKLPYNLQEGCSAPRPEAPGENSNLWYAGANPGLAEGNKNVVVEVGDPFHCKSTMSKDKKPLV